MNAPSTTSSYLVSRTRAVPRGANWAADIAVAFGGVVQSMLAPVRKGMQASSQARARAELLKLADAYERTQPAFAAELRAASSFDSRD